MPTKQTLTGPLNRFKSNTCIFNHQKHNKRSDIDRSIAVFYLEMGFYVAILGTEIFTQNLPQ